jgi:hypothetical protein
VRGWWRSERVCGTVLGYIDVLASRAKRAVTGCFQGRGERLRRKMITFDYIASVILLVGDTRTAQEGRDWRASSTFLHMGSVFRVLREDGWGGGFTRRPTIADIACIFKGAEMASMEEGMRAAGKEKGSRSEEAKETKQSYEN